MITKRRLILIINECMAVLLILIMIILDAKENGMSYVMQDNAGYYAVHILLCLLLPFGIIKAGWPLSGVWTIAGAAIVSLKGTQLLYFVFERVLEPSYALFNSGGTGWMVCITALSFFSIFNIIVSIDASLDWWRERRAALSESEIEKLEKLTDNMEKVFRVLFIVAVIAFSICLINMCIMDARDSGLSAWEIGIITADYIFSVVMRLLLIWFILFLFSKIKRLFNRPASKEDSPEKKAKSVESCIKEESIQGDMEALTMLERSRRDPREQRIDKRKAFYINISQVQYRLGDFDKARESIQEGLDFDDEIVRLKGGETDATLYLKAKLYDVSSRISGGLKDYSSKLDDCRSMLSALKGLSNADMYHSEIGRAFTEMADALRGLGQYDEALEACDQAVAELKQLVSQKTTVARRSYARLNTVRAKILLDAGKAEEAEECALKSIELYSGMNESYECAIGAAHLVMARIQSKCGNSEKAEKEYLIAEALIRDRYGNVPMEQYAV